MLPTEQETISENPPTSKRHWWAASISLQMSAVLLVLGVLQFWALLFLFPKPPFGQVVMDFLGLIA
jgi:hypothetical protein